MMDISKYIKDEKLRICVKPNSVRNEILGWDDEKKALKIAISEPADKNKANKEIIKFVSGLLKKKVRIKSGLKSKDKTLVIQ